MGTSPHRGQKTPPEKLSKQRAFLSFLPERPRVSSYTRSREVREERAVRLASARAEPSRAPRSRPGPAARREGGQPRRAAPRRRAGPGHRSRARPRPRLRSRPSDVRGARAARPREKRRPGTRASGRRGGPRRQPLPLPAFPRSALALPTPALEGAGLGLRPLRGTAVSRPPMPLPAPPGPRPSPDPEGGPGRTPGLGGRGG